MGALLRDRPACIAVMFGAALSVLAAGRAFTSYASVKPVLEAQRDGLPAELRNADAAKWTAWSRRQDQAIRARLEQGDLDSMVNLLLFGTSFTKQPRIRMDARAHRGIEGRDLAGPGGRSGDGSAQSGR